MTNKEEIESLKKRVSELEAITTTVREKIVYIYQPYPVYPPFYYPYYPLGGIQNYPQYCNTMGTSNTPNLQIGTIS